MGFGAYPELSLAQARKCALEAHSLVTQGIDPKEHRKQQKLDEQKVSKHTLTNVASDWFELKKLSLLITLKIFGVR